MQAPEPFEPDHFEIRGDIAYYRPRGSYAEFRLAVAAVARGMAHAVRQPGVRRMLVNSSELSGFPPPTMMDRYEMGKLWAESEAGSGIHIALVARAELIDPKKFGALVATNRGTSNDVFTNEEDALRWLAQFAEK
ncbi:hypothetical protein ETAA8_52150 [Anatilimnocola aggregata]|uniref:STAS/SEC14 domain-containing protein n=1 Tax=Anatilimnocola aggregata TaxID=2528021 RepID=A0A517YIQ6_9BACT|nr:hypothetical protein [Anatilimnocola aggregata]QDU30096.1 hypothetical protein ETAA8_52150 [Anatilimnocola aggregata]